VQLVDRTTVQDHADAAVLLFDEEGCNETSCSPPPTNETDAIQLPNELSSALSATSQQWIPMRRDRPVDHSQFIGRQHNEVVGIIQKLPGMFPHQADSGPRYDITLQNAELGGTITRGRRTDFKIVNVSCFEELT
jgi:hypothetical protein